MKIRCLVRVLILAALFPLISCKGGEEEISAAEPDTAYAKDFSLASLDGNKKVELKDFRGKPLVINFWSSWCGPCREEMPFLQKSWSEYKDKGVTFLGIDVLDEENSAKAFINVYGISYPNLKDPSGEIANAYGVIALPVTFFIDKEGKIIRRNYGAFVGEDGEKNFRKYIMELMK
jgi:peroxiredoxin